VPRHLPLKLSRLGNTVCPLEVLEELYDLELETEDVDTVGGLVFSRHGSVPEVGTEVPSPDENLLFRVEEMDGRRIVSVQAKHIDTSTEDEEPS